MFSWFFFWAVILYGSSINNVMAYDQAGWRMPARVLHGFYRGVIILVFVWLVIRGFQDVGVLGG